MISLKRIAANAPLHHLGFVVIPANRLVSARAGRHTCPLGQVLGRLTVQPERPGDDVIDKDLILVWADAGRRIITGSDFLGRLLRRIARDDRAGKSGLDTKLGLRDTERQQSHPDSP